MHIAAWPKATTATETAAINVQLSESFLSASWGPMKNLLRNVSEHHNSIVLSGLRGSLIGPPLCRETPVSTTADASFSSLTCTHAYASKFSNTITVSCNLLFALLAFGDASISHYCRLCLSHALGNISCIALLR